MGFGRIEFGYEGSTEPAYSRRDWIGYLRLGISQFKASNQTGIDLECLELVWLIVFQVFQRKRLNQSRSGRISGWVTNDVMGNALWQ